MYRIGVDIGGTNISLGLLDDDLEIRASRSIPFQRGGDRVAKIIAEQVHMMLEEAGIGQEELSCIGVAVPGSIDPAGELVINAYNLGFHNEPLRLLIQAHFPDLPVAIGNDADAAVLAELYKGALKGCKTAALYTIGTGIGGGFILDGRMFRGGRGNGSELGHAILVVGGIKCTCGVAGCVESYCSATAIIRQANMAMTAHPESLLYKHTAGAPEVMTAKLAIDCAKAGDKAALEVFRAYVGYLGSAIASMMNMLDMEVVAIGGGVSGAGEFLFEALSADVDSKCFFKNHGSVVPARMGNTAGVVGAAMFYHNACDS